MKHLKQEIIYPILFFILSFLFFYTNLTFSYLQMGDVILWDIKNIKEAILSGHLYFWNNAYFTISSINTVPIHPKSLLMLIFPETIYPQMTVIFHITIMGYGIFLFLREKTLSKQSAIFGAIALMFSNALITLILPGHLGKFETYCYFPLVLYFLSRAMNRESIIDFFYSGAFLGIAFLGGALDVAMYFALFLSCYFLFLLLKKRGDRSFSTFLKEDIKRIILLCLKFSLVAIFSFFMAIQIIMVTKNTQDMGAAGVNNKQELWFWATRWSYPPEEVLGFFIPGLFGYYSGSETHPYWGRIAYVEGEPKTNNFSLTATNIGYITFLFLIFAFFLDKKKYSEKYFWICTALFFLLASFGRYFPLVYGTLFQIPIFRDARNPNKFIEIIPIPFSILASFSADYIFNFIKIKKDSNDVYYRSISLLKKIMYIFIIIALACAIITFFGKSFISDNFIAYWKIEKANIIAKNIYMSFIRFTLISATVYLLLKNIITDKEITVKDKYLPILPFLGFILFSVLDSIQLGAFFIGVILVFIYIFIANNKELFFKSIPYICSAILFLDLAQSGNIFLVKSNANEMYNTTPIVDHILKENKNETTMPILIPYLYRYTTHTMPNYKIPLTEPPAASRLSKEVTDMFTAFRIQDYATYDPRLMDLLGVRYILSPTYLDNSIIANNLEKITEYQDMFSAAVLYELRGYRNKYEFVKNIYSANDYNDALSRIKLPYFNLQNEVVLLDYTNKTISNNTNNIHTVDIIEYSDRKISFNVKTPDDGVLVSKERFDNNWRVFVNGVEKDLLKANILFRGVYLEAGDNNVEFVFKPTMIYLYSTIICWFIFIIVSIITIYFKLFNRHN